MKKSKIISFQGEDVTVKELTVEEIAACMDAVLAGSVDLLDMLMEGALPSEAVIRATGLERPALHALAPSALEPIWEAVRETNPFFAGMLARRSQAPVSPAKR